MAEKFVQRHSVAKEITRKRDTSRFVSDFLNPENEANDSAVSFSQVNVNDITPRCINKYRQSRIEQLAASIENTNNRLIHPIVLVKAEDLPENHEVRKALEEQGTDISGIKYIIVSGERRYRAWMLLRKKEAARTKGQLGITNSFDTITANILTKEEAQNEQVYYQDSNIQARHLTPAECVWFIKDALKEVTTNEQKRAALIKLNNGSDIGIDPDPNKAAKAFRVDNYCKMLLNNEMGIIDWSDATIRNMATVAINCIDAVADALIAGEFTITEARNIATLSSENQLKLLELYKTDRAAYEKEVERLKTPAKKAVKVTHNSTKKQVKADIKKLTESRKAIEKLAASFADNDRSLENDILAKYDALIMELTSIAKIK